MIDLIREFPIGFLAVLTVLVWGVSRVVAAWLQGPPQIVHEQACCEDLCDECDSVSDCKSEVIASGSEVDEAK